MTPPIPPVCATGLPWANYPGTLQLTPFSTCTPYSLDDLVAIVQRAETEQKHVHPFGSKWSFSDCAVSADYVIDMTNLNGEIQTVQRALNSAASSLQSHIYHVQAGITVHDLYLHLDQRNLAIETMGGASGQTLAGAISTGTHGGDYFKAPLADSVLAIHLVGTGGRQYWIERQPGITNPGQLHELVVPTIAPGDIIYDNSTFDAALVSLGCMGVIYAVVLRVRDKYDLIETTTATTWHGFLRTAAAHLNDPSNRFLQVALDPYRDSNGENACLMTIRREGDATSMPSCPGGNIPAAIMKMAADMIAAAPADAAALMAEELVTVLNRGDVGTAFEVLTRVINSILQRKTDVLRSVLVADYAGVMLAYWPPGTCGGPSWRVMDLRHRQGSTSSPSRGYSIEMFVPWEDATGRGILANFIEALIQKVTAATTTFLAGYVSIRFSGPTRACLGMQQWNQTCCVEISALPGIEGELALLGSILELMYDHGGLPHWGQLLDLDRQGYGSPRGHGSLYSRFAEWRQAYATTSNNFTARTFENALSRRWNLTSHESATVLHVAGVTDSGGTFHTIRSTEGGWLPFGNVKAAASDPGRLVAISCAEVRGQLHVVGVTDSSSIVHTIRSTNGNWEPFANVNIAAGDPHHFVAVGCAEVNGQLHVVGVTDSGGMFHSIRYDAGWVPFGDVKTVVSDPGIFAAVGCAAVSGELHVVGVTDSGGMFHTIRHTNSWQIPFADVKTVVSDPGKFVAVGCAEVSASVNGELHVVGVTDSGGMFHTIRHTNFWQIPFGDVKAASSDPGRFIAVGCAEVNGQLHVMGVADSGGMFHTIRSTDGSWLPFGNVKAAASDPGRFVAIGSPSRALS